MLNAAAMKEQLYNLKYLNYKLLKSVSWSF